MVPESCQSQKEENEDTGTGLNTVRKGKIGVKSLFLDHGEYSGEYSPTETETVIILESKNK